MCNFPNDGLKYLGLGCAPSLTKRNLLTKVTLATQSPGASYSPKASFYSVLAPPNNWCKLRLLGEEAET